MIADEDPVRLPITDVFDLHSVPPKEVQDTVEAYLEEAQHAGLTVVRIVHGRGLGVQRRMVRAVLARSPLVACFGDAPPQAGGWGATVVYLR